MAISDRLRLLLREKYGLVHVPSRHKMTAWVSRTRDGCAAGADPEDAGLAAARELFPYELKEHAVYTTTAVVRLLELARNL